jgi:1A family penicillin-binding protein
VQIVDDDANVDVNVYVYVNDVARTTITRQSHASHTQHRRFTRYTVNRRNAGHAAGVLFIAMSEERNSEQPRKRRYTPPNERVGYVPAPGSAKVEGQGSKVEGQSAKDAQRPSSSANRQSPPAAVSQQPIANSAHPSAKPKARKKKRTAGAKIARAFFAFALLVFVLFFAAVILGTAGYMAIARDVPDVSQLADRQSTFASTKIYDSKGSLLVELTDPSNPVAGRRTRVPLSQISDWVKKATIATEDPNFGRYTAGVGFDPIAIIRAVYYAVTERDVVSGGSTITQQVARNLLLSPEERVSRSPMRKIREIILANEMTRRYSPDQILEIYLNEINYGNLAYGIEAAAQTYFNKPAKDLNLAEGSLLAGLPQSPVYWDPVANKDNALRRQNTVLRLMAERSYITDAQIFAAQQEIKDKTFTAPPPNFTKIAPHFMQFVQQQLDAEYGAKGLYRDGLRVYTSLDQDIQKIAEQAIKDNIAKLADKNVTNGAAVIIDPKTGEIRALVGSADFFNEAIDGQVNIALAYRQPGSSIKPFTYLAAIEKGWTPATLFWDQPKTFTNEFGQTYTPKNYDNKFHGPMLMREALARSMNIPAVETLDFVGVPNLLAMAQRVGINFPPNPQYGLAITLGGAEARLIDMTAGYAVLANNGVKMQPTAITRVESADGTLLRDYRATQGEQVVRPEHAYLITSILSDNNARAKSFGANSVLKLSRPAAVKTGTTNDYRDNLAIGYSPDLVAGVWVGNADNSEMQGVSGITGAAPIWHDIMEGALANVPAKDFAPPAGVVGAEICELGGHAPSPNCPNKRIEFFKSDQLPLPADENVEKAVAAGDPNLVNAPQPTANPNPQSPDILISEPAENAPAARGVISIRGTVNPPGFQQYIVEYGDGDNPGEWKWISGPHLSPVVNDQLTQWNTSDLPSGRYTLRMTVNTASGILVGTSRFDVGP